MTLPESLDVKPKRRQWRPPFTAESFWALVSKSDGCWQWQGSVHTSGYGQLTWQGRFCRAHRLAAYLSGLIDNPRDTEHPRSSRLVLHHCDNRLCCNPAHLYVGTAADNVRDCIKRARRPSHAGTNNPMAKFSEGQIREILRLLDAGVPRPEIAKRFDVHLGTIYAIARGKHWSLRSLSAALGAEP